MDERVTPGVTDVGNVRRHIARYNLALALCSGKSVLDMACGTGYGTKLISYVAKEVVGVDVSQEAIDTANLEFNNQNAYYYCYDVIGWCKDWREPHYNTVVCFETLEHLDGADLFVFDTQIKKMVKKGGKIIYSVPLDEEKGWNPHHKQIFNLEQARNIFDLDFEDEFIQVGLNFYHIGEEIPEGKQTYIGVRRV